MSAFRDKVRRLISLHEGRIPFAYQDSLGYWTIGVGHLIDQRKGGRLPEHIIDALLDHDIDEHARGLENAHPWVADLDPVRRAVLYDMAFNLGVAGLLKWPIFLGQVRRKEWDAAAANMLATKWATQVKGRARRLAAMMRTGRWPSEIESGGEQQKK